VFGVPAGLLVMALVSRFTKPPGPAQVAVIERMRFPAPGER
jgi:Na+(H+)/acetate symporter ActP